MLPKANKPLSPPAHPRLFCACWRFAYFIIYHLLLPLIFWRSFKKHGKNFTFGQWWAMKSGKLNNALMKDAPTLWIHAVSLGEMRTVALMLRAWQEQQADFFQDINVLLTTHTATGYTAAKNIVDEWQGLSTNTNIIITFMPFDTEWAWRDFYKHTKPNLLLLMEGEWWPALSWFANQKKLSWLIINARMSPKTFTRRLRLNSYGVNTLWSAPTAIIAQDAEQSSRLQILSPTSHHFIGGQIKYAVAVSEQQQNLGNTFRRTMAPTAKSPILMLASSRVGEESIFIAAWQKVKLQLTANNINCRLLVVPRHPERIKAVSELLAKLDKKVMLRSAINPSMDYHNIDIWLGDSMGEMIAYYHAASLVVMGGCLLPYGGQNPLEAFAVGVPVIFGAHTYNFAQVRKQALDSGAALGITEQEDLIDGLVKHIVGILIDQSTTNRLTSQMVSAQQTLMQNHHTSVSNTLKHIQTFW